MSKVSTQAVNAYGAKIIFEHLTAMQAEVEGVMTGEDIEYVHRMRVASRRLRSSLAIFKDSFPKNDFKQFAKDIRGVTRALGQARDLDVQIETLENSLPDYKDPRLSPGVNRLLLRLKQQRLADQSQVVTAMKTLEEDETIWRIARWAAPWLEKTDNAYLNSPVLLELAFLNIKTQLQAMVNFDRLIRDETNVAELHAMRISAKRLRYTMEIFERLYGEQIKPFISQTKRLQDLLGTIHDADVWMEMIPIFIKQEEQRIINYFGHNRPLRRLKPGLIAFREDRKASRSQDYKSFILLWQKTLDDAIWQNLETLNNAPLGISGINYLNPTPGS